MALLILLYINKNLLISNNCISFIFMGVILLILIVGHFTYFISALNYYPTSTRTFVQPVKMFRALNTRGLLSRVRKVWSTLPQTRSASSAPRGRSSTNELEQDASIVIAGFHSCGYYQKAIQTFQGLSMLIPEKVRVQKKEFVSREEYLTWLHSAKEVILFSS